MKNFNNLSVILSVCLILILFNSAIKNPKFALAETEVYDDINSDTTWTKAGSPYIIKDDVDVYSSFDNITLTIDPGVVLKFDYGKRLIIRGAMMSAIGDSGNEIVFTSIYDDEYGGDTGGSQPPQPGDWDCIQFIATTKGGYPVQSARGTLKYCLIRYGGSGERGNVRAESVSLYGRRRYWHIFDQAAPPVQGGPATSPAKEMSSMAQAFGKGTRRGASAYGN